MGSHFDWKLQEFKKLKSENLTPGLVGATSLERRASTSKNKSIQRKLETEARQTIDVRLVVGGWGVSPTGKSQWVLRA